MKFCACRNPQPQPVEGIMVCAECGEHVADPLLVALVRKVDAIGKPEPSPPNGQSALPIPPELIEAIAERAAELVTERMAADNGADGWLRGAESIADYIGAKRSRVYALATCNPPRIPVEHDGSSLLALRSELDSWIRNGGGKRP